MPKLFAPTVLPGRPLLQVHRQLMCLALLACIYRADEEVAVFHAVMTQVLDDTWAYRLVRSMAMGLGGRDEPLDDELRGELDPGADERGRLASAVALLLRGEPGWRHRVEHVLSTSVDPDVRRAAYDILAFTGLLRTMQ